MENNKLRLKKFLDIFDKEVLNKLLNNENVEKPLCVSIPYITLGIKGKKPYKTLQRLYFDQIEIFENKKIRLSNITEDRRAGIQILIDLEKNDLLLDLNNLIVKFNNDDDLINAEIDLDNAILLKEYLLNGSLRIYCPEGNLLAHSDYFMPTNIIISESGILSLEERISQIKQKIEAFKDNKTWL